MKLSIITPVYRESKMIEKFMERLSKQTSKDFEVIFTVDTNTEDVLKIIDDYKSKIKGTVKVIYRSKRSGRNYSIMRAFKIITGDYAVITSLSDSFEDTLVSSCLAAAKDKGSDIIEFRARIKEPIKIEGQIRKPFNKVTNIETLEDVFAFSYPFDFNKIYKASVLKEVAKLPLFTTKLNSRYAVEIVFKALLVAKSYSTIDKKIIRSKRIIDDSFNPLRMIREWKEVVQREEFKPYYSALVYNFLFTNAFIISGITATAKNKVLYSKYDTEVKGFISHINNFYETNRFIIARSKENELLLKHRNKDTNKLYKEI